MKKMKASGDSYPKRRQVCSLRQKELEIEKLSAFYSDTSAKLQDLSIVLDNSTLLAELKHNVNIADMNMSSIHAKMRDKGGVDDVTLENNFGTGIEVAKIMRLVTTQRGGRKMIHPSLNKRYKTNDRKLRYRRLPVTLFTDTMYSTILSRQGNKATQVFCDGAGWGRALPMKKEKEAHEALSMLFHRDGVPNVMVMDGAKAQVQGEFRIKLRDAGCYIRQNEPHTQSYNMGEGGVRELKRGVGRQILRSDCPKRLWDD
jgi:hypothetical protein